MRRPGVGVEAAWAGHAQRRGRSRAGASAGLAGLFLCISSGIKGCSAVDPQVCVPHAGTDGSLPVAFGQAQASHASVCSVPDCSSNLRLLQRRFNVHAVSCVLQALTSVSVVTCGADKARKQRGSRGATNRKGGGAAKNRKHEKQKEKGAAALAAGCQAGRQEAPTPAPATPAAQLAWGLATTFRTLGLAAREERPPRPATMASAKAAPSTPTSSSGFWSRPREE